MKSTGYSGKPLIEKLGYMSGEKVYLSGAPEDFSEYLLGEGIIGSALPAVWAHGFFRNKAYLLIFLDSVNFKQIEKGFWVSWPKRSSGIETDLTEQTFRDMILPLGWVDTKVAAIDEIWSGLKFLRRKT